MIPQRVRLQGFLCYKEPQEVGFQGGSLWLLAGLNGSGKSAIFDAVTYALFGHHRGGGQQAIELINKDSTSLSVEFDFLLDQQLYRAKRTLRPRSSGGAQATQQILRWQSSNGDADGSWEPLADTNRKKEFDAWVSEHIGLDYETFTSSILLLQGNAEKLLNSSAKGRHEVLAGIVDLERYEDLHRRADDRRKLHFTNSETLHSRLAVLPEVTAEELAQADERIGTAETERSQAQAAVERLQSLAFQARQWGELQGRLTVARQRWQQAQRLLAEAPAIEQAIERLRQLREVLPRVQSIMELRQQITLSEQQTTVLSEQWDRLREQRTEQDHALEQTRQKRTNLQQRIASDEQRHREIAARLRQAVTQLEKLKEYEQQETELKRLQAELARLPADPAQSVARAQERIEQLAALAQVVPALARLQSHRENLRGARSREQTALEARQAITSRGEQLAAEIKQLKPQVEDVTRVRRQADDEAAAAVALLQQARKDLDEFRQLEGAKTCRHCGQPLTANHFESEMKRRQCEVHSLGAQASRASAAQQLAQKTEHQLQQQLTVLETKCQDARVEYRDCQNQAEQARRDVERLHTECAQTVAELPESFRRKVSQVSPSDWTATVYPTAADLDALREQAAGLAGARQQLREAERVLQQWSAGKAQEADKRQGLARLQADLPADRQAVRQEHVRLESEEAALDRSLAARRLEAADAQKQLDRLTREHEQLQAQSADIGGKLNTEDASRRLWQQTLTRTRKELPGDWQTQADHCGLAQVNDWRQERDELIEQQTEERGRQLQQARAGLEVLRQTWTDLENQLAEFPEEARQEPARIQAMLETARTEQRSRDDALSEARQRKLLLQAQQQKRQLLQEELLAEEEEHNSYELLAKLLGRDRLQLHLLRQAERQVVDHANAVLDRLSGGQLYLRLCGEAGGEDTTAKALELEASNRTTTEKPINVAFLSGSQKFRVAVSLALGIGQYASRQHRAIEAVIIDEGFGCLDRQGRQVMIQELHNLRSQLRCILLVSHQEEFADAFADRYHFELTEGSTRVTRCQR